MGEQVIENFAALRHQGVEAVNSLIRSCLLEERSGDNTYTYVPKAGAHQALKWTFHNGLGLVFVAVYQKTLSLMYVDELLSAVKADFTSNHYRPNVMTYPGFTDSFNRIYKDCETRAERLKTAATQKGSISNGKAAAGKAAGVKAGASQAAAGSPAGKAAASDDGEEDGDSDGDAAAGAGNGMQSAAEAHHLTTDADGTEEESGAGAFDLSKFKGGKAAARGRGARGGPSPAAPKKKEEKKEVTKGKKARDWSSLRRGDMTSDKDILDYSKDKGTDYTAGSESDRQGYSDYEGGRSSAAQIGVSRMDQEEIIEDVAALLEEDDQGQGKPEAQTRGVLGSFVSSLKLRVVGKTSLTAQDLAPALIDMKKKLMERNVAEEIAQKICESVCRQLEGKKLASFTGLGTFVARAFEESLSGILNKRTVDMLLGIKEQQAKGKPYVVVFCGVNGVGKSTNLAKIAYWLGQHGIKVLIAACDTFRAGAVEQLKTHCARLQVPLYEKGYEKDPAKVANEAIRQAEREGRHVVLVDTAGRMQDNEPLMRALSNLINMNQPNLVLFVGEALVGNDAVDQLVKFNRALHDLAPPTATKRHVIDGIVLTKFDTIDDKVGAAVSMVYASGAPIMFLGCGQTYADLKKLNVKAVVNALLK